MPISFEHEKILVLGAGITGNAVARALSKRGAVIAIVDENPEATSEFEILSVSNVDIQNFQKVVISPGWREDHPLIVAAKKASLPILNEVDLAWQIRCDQSPTQRWIALTGTNGKTSTVELVAAMLTSGGINAIACGNVGETIIDVVDRRDAYDVLAIELSSFQLHWSQEAQFVASAILNIADDHIDWHGNFENYAQTKFSLLDRSSTAIINGDDGFIVKGTNHWQGRKVFYSLESPAPGQLGLVENLLVDRAFVADPQEASVFAELNEVQPTVPHNVSNALAAAGLARAVGVSHDAIRHAIQEFRPGRHRIETIYSAEGITWVDDSKATNPHAATASLLGHQSVVWIAGGLAKGADMQALVEKTSHRLKAVILIGQDHNLIEEGLLKYCPEIPRTYIDGTDGYFKGGHSNLLMERVVKAAKDYASPGDTVLLAPACASMDQFLSYADRGDRFAQAVKKVVAHEE